MCLIKNNICIFIGVGYFLNKYKTSGQSVFSLPVYFLSGFYLYLNMYWDFSSLTWIFVIKYLEYEVLLIESHKCCTNLYFNSCYVNSYVMTKLKKNKNFASLPMTPNGLSFTYKNTKECSNNGKVVAKLQMRLF